MATPLSLALSVAEGDLVGEIAVRNALTILAAQLPRVLPTIVKPVRRSGGWAMVQRQWQSWAARGN